MKNPKKPNVCMQSSSIYSYPSFLFLMLGSTTDQKEGILTPSPCSKSTSGQCPSSAALSTFYTLYPKKLGQQIEGGGYGYSLNEKAQKMKHEE